MRRVTKRPKKGNKKLKKKPEPGQFVEVQRDPKEYAQFMERLLGQNLEVYVSKQPALVNTTSSMWGAHAHITCYQASDPFSFDMSFSVLAKTKTEAVREVKHFFKTLRGQA